MKIKGSVKLFIVAIMGIVVAGCGGGGGESVANLEPLPDTPPTGSFFINMPLSSVSPTTIPVGAFADVSSVVFFKTLITPGQYKLSFYIGNDVPSATLISDKVIDGTEGTDSTGNNNTIRITRSSSTVIAIEGEAPVDISTVNMTQPVFGIIKACIEELDHFGDPICASEAYELQLP